MVAFRLPYQVRRGQLYRGQFSIRDRLHFCGLADLALWFLVSEVLKKNRLLRIDGPGFAVVPLQTTLDMKNSVCLILFAVATLSSGQGTLSCGTDNLSCPRGDPDSQILQCITASQLCDGTSLCSGGHDEGENLSTVECKIFTRVLN